MVVTCFPSTRDSGATQDRMALPSRCTVQAPHKAIPQPNFVPVSPNESRNTHNNGVEGSPSTWTGFPFTKKLVTCDPPPLSRKSNFLFPIGWRFQAQGYEFRENPGACRQGGVEVNVPLSAARGILSLSFGP